MKEKRYYCDWMMGKVDEKTDRLIGKVMLISFIVGTVICSVIYYAIFMHNYSEYLEAYPESAYEYLNEIADNVISKDGINVSAIPEEVEITYEDGEIVFEYYFENNKEIKLPTYVSMTVTLSENFEILSKKPNFSSKEDYVKSRKICLYILITLLGVATWGGIVFMCLFVAIIAIPISAIHKKKDTAKNLS